jgi:hypothetical protein
MSAIQVAGLLLIVCVLVVVSVIVKHVLEKHEARDMAATRVQRRQARLASTERRIRQLEINHRSSPLSREESDEFARLIEERNGTTLAF